MLSNLCLANLWLALAIVGSSAAKTGYIVTYENLFVDPIHAQSVLSTYNGLIYNQFFVTGLTQGHQATTGLQYHSLPQAAVTNPLSQNNPLGQNQPNGVVIPGTVPNVTVASGYKNVKLHNFWFGCNQGTPNGFVNTAVDCTVTLNALNKANEPTSSAQYSFQAPADGNSAVPMIEAILPAGFEKAHTITFITDKPRSQALFLDNVNYTLHS